MGGLISLQSDLIPQYCFYRSQLQLISFHCYILIMDRAVKYNLHVFIKSVNVGSGDVSRN